MLFFALRILLQHGGKKLLKVKTKSGKLPIDMTESNDMIQLLENPPDGATNKRRYKNLSSSFQESSQQSMILSQNSYCGDITWQPSPEIYSEILDSECRKLYVCRNELLKYVVTVLHLLQSYVEAKNLKVLRSICRQHSEGLIDLTIDVDVNEVVKNQQVHQLEGGLNCVKTTGSKAPVVDNITKPRLSRTVKSKKPPADVSHDTVKIESSSPRPLDPIDVLEEDMDSFKELKYHVRGFESHLRRLWENGSDDTVLEDAVKMYVTTMRSLHVD